MFWIFCLTMRKTTVMIYQNLLCLMCSLWIFTSSFPSVFLFSFTIKQPSEVPSLHSCFFFWALEQSEVLTQYVHGPPRLLSPTGSQLTTDAKCSSTGVLKQLLHAADGTLFHLSALSKWWYLDSFLTDFWLNLKLTKDMPGLQKRSESPDLFHFRIVQVYSKAELHDTFQKSNCRI